MPFEMLTQPVRIGHIELRNRIAMPPMTMCYAAADDGVSQREIDYLSERAKGGVGLIIVGGACVEGDMGKLFASTPVLCIDRDDLIPGYRKLTDALHGHGAKAAIQLYHAGRQTTLEKTGGRPPIAPSAVTTKLLGIVPMPDSRAATLEEVYALEDAFAEAARRAQGAGFDAVLIDGGAGYLIGQFMSPFTNKRTDAYGGSLENRMRFPLKIIEKTKKKVGDDFTLLFDLPSDELIDGGIDVDESTKMAKILEAAGIDAFRVHVALYETYQYVIPPAAVPHAVHARLGRALKENLTTAKVMLGHRINDPWIAERVLAEGAADVVLLGRPLIADPEFCNKVIEDRPEDIRKCIACNIGCAGYIVAGRPATCTVNPRVGKEGALKMERASRPKTVMIAGAGVGGLEAALVASQRGHSVSLYEKTDHIGGWAAVGCIPPHKHEIKDLLEYYERQLGKQGIAVHYGVTVDRRLIHDEKPDVVILATGSVALTPPIPGIDAPHVHSFLDILTGKAKAGDDVVVIGGGQTGLETAEYLAEMGKSVTVIEMQAEAGADMELFTKVMTMPRLEKLRIKLVTGETVTSIDADSVHCGDQRFDAETVVVAVGQRSDSDICADVAGAAPQVYTIGDCVAPRRLLNAIHEGFGVANRI